MTTTAHDGQPGEAAADASATGALRARIAALYPELPLPPTSTVTQAGGLPPAISVPAGAVLFQEMAPCGGFPLVLSGEVRVARGTPGGRSLELYRVGPGELCVVSASALVGHAPMPAHGVAVKPCELVLLSTATFEAWLSHGPFRGFVFGLFAERIAEVIALAEAVAFQRLDQRLAAALLGHGAVVQATHQALADDLGTVREIVSRLLRRFERSGWLVLGRERIDIVNPQALRRVADGLPTEA